MCTNRKRDGQLAKSLAIYLGILAFPTALLAKTTPSISLSKTSLAFGTVNVSASSTAQTVTLSNSGSVTLMISSVTASGDFTQGNTCAASLKKHESCTVSVSFKPSSAGSRTGIVSIIDNAPGSPHQISLNGTGAQLLPQAAVAPSALQFGDITVQSQSAVQMLTLANTGTAPLVISDISASGDFTRTTGCGASVAAGSSCKIQVSAKPTSAGMCVGALTITDNAPGSPHVVTLTSNGLEA